MKRAYTVTYSRKDVAMYERREIAGNTRSAALAVAKDVPRIWHLPLAGWQNPVRQPSGEMRCRIKQGLAAVRYEHPKMPDVALEVRRAEAKDG